MYESNEGVSLTYPSQSWSLQRSFLPSLLGYKSFWCWFDPWGLSQVISHKVGSLHLQCKRRSRWRSTSPDDTLWHTFQGCHKVIHALLNIIRREGINESLKQTTRLNKHTKWTSSTSLVYTVTSKEVLMKYTFPLRKFSLRGATRTADLVGLAHREEC